MFSEELKNCGQCLIFGNLSIWLNLACSICKPPTRLLKPYNSHRRRNPMHPVISGWSRDKKRGYLLIKAEVGVESRKITVWFKRSLLFSPGRMFASAGCLGLVNYTQSDSWAPATVLGVASATYHVELSHVVETPETSEFLKLHFGNFCLRKVSHDRPQPIWKLENIRTLEQVLDPDRLPSKCGLGLIMNHYFTINLNELILEHNIITAFNFIYRICKLLPPIRSLRVESLNWNLPKSRPCHF